jgi:uncharacterized protein (TIGR02266 family)
VDHPTTPKEPRGPISLRIKFRSASLDQFIERYAVDVSRGGIFIRTREPLAVGTQLKFDFQLQDAAPLLAGEGTVVWIRENDPSRANVTPGMGVRFDKLTSSSQPTLEKILAEKTRREQSGTVSKPSTGGGMAVRRPSSTFSALDPAAARAALAAGTQPRTPASATGSGPLGAQPSRPAPATGSGPLGTRPRPAEPVAPRPAPSSMTPRAAAPAPAAPARPKTPQAGLPTLESSGAFGRARHSTGMNAQRSAPAPQALFEKPTADDIDRALAVLTEMDGPPPAAPVAVPVDFSARLTQRPTDAQPTVMESMPDLGGVPAKPRRPTDAQPMVLESAPDLGDPKAPTIPVATIGDRLPSDDEAVEEAEDDATLAWADSGPTHVGGPTTSPRMPAPDLPAPARTRTPTPPPHPELVTREDLPAAVLEPAQAAAPSAPTPAVFSGLSASLPAGLPRTKAKSTSWAVLIIIGLLLMVGAAAVVFVIKGPKLSPGAPVEPAVASSTATPMPSAGKPAEKTELGAAEKVAAVDASAAPAQAAGEAQPQKTTAPTPTDAATPATLRLRPLAAEPKEAPAEALKAGAAAPTPTSMKGKGGAHRKAAAAAAAPTEPGALSTDTPAAATVENVSPSQGAAKEPARAASVLKVSSTPAGAEVIVDGASVGRTPYLGNDLDPALPHSITLKRDGFEDHEHMIGASDWPRAHNGTRTLKLNVKLRSTSGGAGPATLPPEATEPAPGEGTTPATPHRE